MNTEEKINEEYIQWLSTAPDAAFVTLEDAWKSGYLTLLSSLEPTGVFARNKEREQVMTYRLPEGVTKP